MPSRGKMQQMHSLETTNSTPWKQRIAFLSRLFLLSTLGSITLLLLLRYLCLPILAYIYPELNIFDTGIYGAYPEQYYISSDLRSPLAKVVQWDSTCDDGSLVLLTLDGNSVSNPGSMIVDMRGNLIWKSDEYGMTMNAKIQTYQNQDYITFWSGDKLQESGLGMYYMLDSTYEIAHTVEAVGDVRGDLHEFKITPEGTALITIYPRWPITFDMSLTSTKLSQDDILIDGMFQEIDIATGDLLFEWRASEHFDSGYLATSHGGYVADQAFDYFHINSIDKDSAENYLVSLRHLNTIVYIDGRTSEILWALGGTSEDFEDLSDGEASNFSWQHDARWVSEEEGLISVFSNGMAHKHYDEAYSRGLLLQLDLENWTVELVREYTSLNLIGSASQGNVQLLEGDGEEEQQMFIGWGASAAFSQHAFDGELLCETHFGAEWLFYFERVKSYRAWKSFGWVGRPAWNPEVQIEGGRLYVSWNGATEVEYWVLEGKKGGLKDGFEEVDTLRKGKEFESSFVLPGDREFVSWRVMGVDGDGKVVGVSDEVFGEDDEEELGWAVSLLMFLVPAVAVCFLAYRHREVLREKLAWRRNEAPVVGDALFQVEELAEIETKHEEDGPVWVAEAGEETQLILPR